jgi:energy-converting hydrogenase A subunit B
MGKFAQLILFFLYSLFIIKKKKSKEPSISEPLSFIPLIYSVKQDYPVHPMLDEPIRILIAALICWFNFIIIDLIFRLPERGGVSGATAIAQEVEKGGGKLNGGYMMGNIVSSPDASAGTLLAGCGVYCAGLPGGLFAALLVYIGNRICYDPGYAGTTGCISATFIVYGAVQSGWFAASDFIAGMVIAILTIQGLSSVYASRLIARLWKIRCRLLRGCT